MLLCGSLGTIGFAKDSSTKDRTLPTVESLPAPHRPQWVGSGSAYLWTAGKPHSGGMDTTIKDEIRAENNHHSNEINARNLEQYHQMLNSFNTQATLIVGFALNSSASAND